MSRTFERAGISFQYPEGWRLEREENESGWTVHLQSPGTAFMTLTCDETMPQSEEMAETALEALRADYPTLEAEALSETLAGQTAVGHEIEFISFDMVNSCWTRSFPCKAGTVLMLCHTSDIDPAPFGTVLRAVCATLRVEG